MHSVRLQPFRNRFMATPPARHPLLSRAGRPAEYPITVVDESGTARDIHIPMERALTLYVDRRELVTLMTLGLQPEWLALGYLRTQGLVDALDDIAAVQVDWEVEAAAVRTRHGIPDWDTRLGVRTVTTGCGQGTMFGRLSERAAAMRLQAPLLHQSQLYALGERLRLRDTLYKRTGSIHGCALCAGDEVCCFVEDVGRHNAVDAIAGWMWLEGIDGAGKLFYTTGRLTSEMVLKTAQMGVPVLVSRSGTTQAAVELARRIGVTLIGRLRNRHFFVYHGAERVRFDAVPPPLPRAPDGKEHVPADAPLRPQEHRS